MDRAGQFRGYRVGLKTGSQRELISHQADIHRRRARATWLRLIALASEARFPVARSRTAVVRRPRSVRQHPRQQAWAGSAIANNSKGQALCIASTERRRRG